MDSSVEHRAGARHDSKERDATKRLEILAERFQYFKVFLKDFKEVVDSQKLCERSIPYNKQRLKEDPKHFYLDMSKSNYLTMLYKKEAMTRQTDKFWEEMENQVKETLQKDKQNFQALWLYTELLLKKKEYTEMEEKFSELEKVSNDKLVMLITKAEVGINYPDFGPMCYEKSVTLLEEVLHELTDSPDYMTKLSPLQLIKLKYDLAHTYTKVMNKGNVATYWKGSEPPSRLKLFKCIKALSVEVTNYNAEFYSPKAWIDLADAFKKYEEPEKNKENLEQLPNGITIDECFEKALQLASRDPYVLERCGRHIRHRATTIEGFQRAIEVLDNCVQLDPRRDVAWHHMGLAYRSIWHQKEGQEPRWIHANGTKKFNKKKSMKNSRPASNQQCNNLVVLANSQLNAHKDSQLCSIAEAPGPSQKGTNLKQANNDNNVSKSGKFKDEYGIKYRQVSSTSTSSKNQVGTSEPSVKGTTFNSSRRDSNNKFSLDFKCEQLRCVVSRRDYCSNFSPQGTAIPPKFRKTETEVPRHCNRRPIYYDRLKADNPVAKNPQHTDLLEARKCFQQASDLRHGSSGRYLIDLARTYISTKDINKAVALLQMADATDMNDNDGAYLFEQWGLVADQTRKPIEAVKDFYRTAINCSAGAKQRSKVAFNKLKEILDHEMKENPSEILKKEQLLLMTTIQDAGKAEVLLKQMTDYENLPLIWELVDMYYKRNRTEDADAAFNYLAMLYKAKKLNHTDTRTDKNIIFKERSEMIIEIAKRRLKENDPKSIFTNIFKWLLALTASGEDPEQGQDLAEKYKIRLIAPSSESPAVEEVKDILENVLGMEFHELFIKGSSDILLGSVIPNVILSDMKGTECAIAVLQCGGEEKLENKIVHLLATVINDPYYNPKRICRAVTKKSQEILDERMSVITRWNLDEGESEENCKLFLGIDLLKKLFLQ